jgi:hypothetical protein
LAFFRSLINASRDESFEGNARHRRGTRRRAAARPGRPHRTGVGSARGRQFRAPPSPPSPASAAPARCLPSRRWIPRSSDRRLSCLRHSHPLSPLHRLPKHMGNLSHPNGHVVLSSPRTMKMTLAATFSPREKGLLHCTAWVLQSSRTKEARIPSTSPRPPSSADPPGPKPPGAVARRSASASHAHAVPLRRSLVVWR